MKSAILIVTLAIMALGAPLWTPTAQANTLTLSFGAPFGNTDPGKPNPDGPSPWLTAEFTDVTGGVQLDLTASLTGDNFIRLIYFNYIPKIDASGLLTFDPSTGVTLGLNHVNADGDGYYDIELNLDDLGKLTAANPTQSFLIEGPNGLDVSDFEYKSGANGSDIKQYKSSFGPYFAAAHVQSISADPGSTWIYAEVDDDGDIIEVVPEPSTVILLGSGLLGLLYAGRRRSRK
jgi:hypothetical protein